MNLGVWIALMIRTNLVLNLLAVGSFSFLAATQAAFGLALRATLAAFAAVTVLAAIKIAVAAVRTLRYGL